MTKDVEKIYKKIAVFLANYEDGIEEWDGRYTRDDEMYDAGYMNALRYCLRVIREAK